jgi:pimeloyl-ACP methyl ester carboxylesterase
MRQGWGKETSAFRRMFASLYLPEANDEQVRWWTDLQRVATSPDNAVRLRQVIDGIDVSDRLARIRTPTLILHSEREEVAPLAEARFMATRIPGARFVALDSANHLVLPQEAAWRRATDEIEAFLANGPRQQS